MIYPATYNITILQNATWRGSFRATQNRQELTSITIAGTPSTATFTVPCHGLIATNKVVFTGGDDIPCGLSLNVVYFVIAPTVDTFQVSATSGGGVISVTGTATGDFFVATPLDITGYTVDSDIKGLIDDADITTFTPAITDAPNGAFTLTMAPDVSSAIAVGQYGWDISLTQGGEERYYWVTGVATVQRTYSRN